LTSGRELRRRGWRQAPPLAKRKNKIQNIHTHNKHTHAIKFIQINLHHTKRATANLCQQLAEEKEGIALIQEPWIYRGQIRGLTNSWGAIYSAAPGNIARSCIHVRNHINVLPLLQFCSRDATMVTITYIYGGSCEKMIVASAYIPYD
jgi:hypothetical protein